MTHKAILSGRLEFGNPRSCEKALTLFQSRYEVMYRSDVFLKADDVFHMENSSLDLYRFSAQVAEKTWNNTMSLLEEVSQFAMTGKIDAWLTENGEVLQSKFIEPMTEKAAVQAFLKGRELMKEQGHEQDAIGSLNDAITKYERHAAAYERRGYINYRLRNYPDALYDYSKSITFNPAYADAYLGRAVVHIAQDNPAAALLDLEKALKFSVPLQPIFWIARRLKGDCHLDLEQYEAAVIEYQFFLKRNFSVGDVNFNRRRRVSYYLGKALLALRKNKEAVQALEAALKIEIADTAAGDTDIQTWLQEARQRSTPTAGSRASVAV